MKQSRKIVWLVILITLLVALSGWLFLKALQNPPQEQTPTGGETTGGETTVAESTQTTSEDTEAETETTDSEPQDDPTSSAAEDTTSSAAEEQTTSSSTEDDEPPATPIKAEIFEEGMTDAQKLAYLEKELASPYLKLANKDNPLGEDFVPKNLTYVSEYRLEGEAAAHYNKWISAAKNAGHTNLYLYSAYRKYSSQLRNYNNKIESFKSQGYSEAEAIQKTEAVIAPPGTSEHQTGLAADICLPSIVNKYGNLNEAFENTKAFTYLSTTAHKYGFILRYPKNKTSITKYDYEPWHYRYVGEKHAAYIYQNDLTLEEYVSLLQKLKKELS